MIFSWRNRKNTAPSLPAYREMTARVKGLATPGDVRLALYFTACQKKVEL